MGEARITASIPVDFEAGAVRGRGKIKNLSDRGLFVRTNDLPYEGDVVALRFVPPGEGEIRLTGVVWWTTRSCPDRAQRPAGFGLCMIEDSPPYERAIAKLLP